jgi:hypothetical protein
MGGFPQKKFQIKDRTGRKQNPSKRAKSVPNSGLGGLLHPLFSFAADIIIGGPSRDAEMPERNTFPTPFPVCPAVSLPLAIFAGSVMMQSFWWV